MRSLGYEHKREPKPPIDNCAPELPATQVPKVKPQEDRPKPWRAEGIARSTYWRRSKLVGRGIDQTKRSLAFRSDQGPISIQNSPRS
jgi:hypothetical protein